MNTRHAQLDEIAARAHLAMIDPSGRLPLGWALKNELTATWQEQSLATAPEIMRQVRELDDIAHTSWFVTPAPRALTATSRSAGEACRPSVAWTDRDNHLADKPFPSELFTGNGLLAPYTTLVESGSPGNCHVYAHIDTARKPLSANALRLLNYTLCLVCGGDFSQYGDQAVLRCPGGYNYRPSKGLHEPVPVRVAQSATDVIDPRELLRILMAHAGLTNLDYLKQKSKVNSAANFTVVPCDQESLLARVSSKFRRAIRDNDLDFWPGRDQSTQLFNVYRDLYQHSSLERDEIYTLMMSFGPFVDRMGHRPEQEISKAWDEGENDPTRTTERDNFIMARRKPESASRTDKPEPKPPAATKTENRPYTWTDETNAQYLIQNHGRDFFALTTTVGEPLYYWDGSIWTEDGALAQLHKICAAYQATLDDTDEDQQFRQGLHRQGRSAATRANMIRLFKVHIGRKAEELDADPTLLHMGAAVYDSKTGEIREPRRSDLMTKRTRATYDPDATCSQFELHLKRCLPDDHTRDYTRYLLSRVVSGRASKHIPVFVGEPDSGKSAVVNGVAFPLGNYARRVADDVALIKPGNSHKANLHALRDARLGMVHEPSEGTKFNVDQLKSLSGGDEQTSNAMRSNYETWTPRLQLLVTCNKVPNMGEDAGLRERLKFIKFTEVIPHEDRIENFAEKRLHPEAAGILNWLIEAHREYLGVAVIDPPSGVVATREEIARVQNPVHEFIEDQVEAGALVRETAGKIEASDRLYRDLYLTWCKSRNRRTEALTVRMFNKYMRDLGFKSRSSNGRQHWVGLAETVGEL